MKINIAKDGTIKFVYTDKLRSLLEEGVAKVKRASHVEPTADNKWQVDLSLVNGPLLGPFTLREEALAAEVEWLNQNLGKLALL